MSTSGFLYRDILKYVMPTLLFLILIVPLLESSVDYQILILFGIIISLLFGPLLSRISTLLFKLFPNVKKVIKVSHWMNSNWDYRKAFYSLSKDERDYLYLTGAYIEFFKNSGFVVSVFMILSLIFMVIDLKGNYLEYLNHTTCIMSKFGFNTIALIITCFILIGSLKDALIFETKILLYPNGQFEIFAERVQKESKELLAKKIYGNIKELQGIEVKLIYQNKIEATCLTDENGYWSFDFKNE